MSPANHVPSTGGQGLARSSRKGDASAEQGGFFMELMKDSPAYQRNRFMQFLGTKVTSVSLASKMLETFRPLKTGKEREAQAELLCEIITSSKTEEEMLERMDALE